MTRGAAGVAAGVAVVVSAIGIGWNSGRQAPPTIVRSTEHAAQQTEQKAANQNKDQEPGGPEPADETKDNSNTKNTVENRIDINSATAIELELLPRIGPKLAAKIIQSRETRGPFGSVDAMERVKGIGQRTIERLRPYILASQPLHDQTENSAPKHH